MGSKDLLSWFRWIETKQEKIEKTEIKYKQEKITILSKELQNNWKRAETFKSEIQKTVLVRLNNNTIAMAYFTNKEEWKLDIYRNKMSGGVSLKNVVDWKEID